MGNHNSQNINLIMKKKQLKSYVEHKIIQVDRKQNDIDWSFSYRYKQPFKKKMKEVGKNFEQNISLIPKIWFNRSIWSI